jgi:hypothetical protein
MDYGRQFLIADWTGTVAFECVSVAVEGELWVGRLESALAIYWQARLIPDPEDPDPEPAGPPRVFQRAGWIVQQGWTYRTMCMLATGDLPPSLAISDLDSAFAPGPGRDALLKAAMWAVTGQIYNPLRRSRIRVREYRWREPIDGTVA